MTTAAIVLAGGAGQRLGHRDNKVFAVVADRPLLAWSIDTFAASGHVDDLVVVVRDGDQRRVGQLLDATGVRPRPRLVVGGATRPASELAGLEAVADDIADGTIDVVLLHDAARPFASPGLIARVTNAARTVGGAIPTLPLGRGVYRRTDGRLVAQSDDLHRAQTPQGFRAAPLLSAYRRALVDDTAGVDTAETIERHTDVSVAVVAGEDTNIKVTFADDLALAERIAGTLTDVAGSSSDGRRASGGQR